MGNELELDEALTRALIVSAIAHSGQNDLGGNPYILHPLAVANSVTTLEEKIVALLHDVLEDTNVTAEQLRTMGIPDRLVTIVENLTVAEKPDREDYLSEYIPKVAKAGPIAIKVKLADLNDNLRTDRPAPNMDKRTSRYLKAKQLLNEALSKNKDEMEAKMGGSNRGVDEIIRERTVMESHSSP